MAVKTIEATKEQFQQAIQLLENGGTKKAACEVLGIAYNTTRLQTLIDNFLNRQELDKQHRAKKRKEAVKPLEVADWITDYLAGESFDDLSKRYYRSSNVIRYHIAKHGALLRHSKVDKLDPPMVPEQCMSDDFDIGEYVWSMQYNGIVQVKAKYKNAFRVETLIEGVQEKAYLASYELARLKHLEALGVKLEKLAISMPQEEVNSTLRETMMKANKRVKSND
jgi:hypothetical protein